MSSGSGAPVRARRWAAGRQRGSGGAAGLCWQAARRTPASSALVDRHLSLWIDKLLRKYTNLDVRDYASLLQLSGSYRLGELEVQQDGWLCDKTLAEMALRDEGAIVLGIRRASGEYLGAPKGDTCIMAGDSLYVYGRADTLMALDERQPGREGDIAHEAAVNEQVVVEREEAAEAD